MTDEKKKDEKDGKDAKKIEDEQLKDVAGGGGPRAVRKDDGPQDLAGGS